MDIPQVFNLINNWASILIVIPPTIFIFGVTLLGTAIEKTHQEEEQARENQSEKIMKNIGELNKLLRKAKKDKDTNPIIAKIEKLKKDKKEVEKKIKQIKNKYTGINFKNSVALPTLVFLFSSLTSRLLIIFPKFNLDYHFLYLLIIIDFGLILYGISKIYKALNLVQEINSNKKESESYDKLGKTIKQAMAEYDQEKTELIILTFVDKIFPLNVNPQTKLKLDFHIKLKKGKVVKNVKVWFFIPDGFDLINPPESESWRQSADYDIPNVRTIEVKVGDLSVGPNTPKDLTIMSPTKLGKYNIRYKIYGDGYVSPSQEITLFVN